MEKDSIGDSPLMSFHSVEKIGGTSMSNYAAVRDNIILKPTGDTLYQRIFVVSAYAGITDQLLEHKKTGKAGVFASFANGVNDDSWLDLLNELRTQVIEINSNLFGDPEMLADANRFIGDRLDEAEHWTSTWQPSVKCWPASVKHTVPGILPGCFREMVSMPALWI